MAESCTHTVYKRENFKFQLLSTVHGRISAEMTNKSILLVIPQKKEKGKKSMLSFFDKLCDFTKIAFINQHSVLVPDSNLNFVFLHLILLVFI